MSIVGRPDNVSSVLSTVVRIFVREEGGLFDDLQHRVNAHLDLLFLFLNFFAYSLDGQAGV